MPGWELIRKIKDQWPLIKTAHKSVWVSIGCAFLLGWGLSWWINETRYADRFQTQEERLQQLSETKDEGLQQFSKIHSADVTTIEEVHRFLFPPVTTLRGFILQGMVGGTGIGGAGDAHLIDMEIQHFSTGLEASGEATITTDRTNIKNVEKGAVAKDKSRIHLNGGTISGEGTK